MWDNAMLQLESDEVTSVYESKRDRETELYYRCERERESETREWRWRVEIRDIEAYCKDGNGLNNSQ